MKELGETRYYLGIHFTHHPEHKMVHLHQARYIQQLLEQFHMQDAKTVMTPMEENHTLTQVEDPEPGELEEMAGVPYAKLVGSLNFLSYCTRPDISCPVSILSRFVAEGKARRKHWEAAKRVLRYLKGTATHGVTLGGTNPIQLQAYADASWADDLQDRKSTLGYCTFLGAGPISWKSGKSSAVAQSTAESEYYAAGEAAKEVVHLRQLLQTMGFQQPMPTPFGSDSQAALAMTKNPEFHARTKHIDIRHHWLRDIVREGVIQPGYVATEHNPADLLTKALGREKHFHLLSLMKVQEDPEPTDDK